MDGWHDKYPAAEIFQTESVAEQTCRRGKARQEDREGILQLRELDSVKVPCIILLFVAGSEAVN